MLTEKLKFWDTRVGLGMKWSPCQHPHLRASASAPTPGKRPPKLDRELSSVWEQRRVCSPE